MHKNLMLILLVALAGCASTGYVTEKLADRRADYGLPGVFGSLPGPPDNFFSVDEAVSELLIDLTYIEEDYYKQPEFYPTFENYIDRMKNPPEGRIAILGLGAYPADQVFDAASRDEIKTSVFFHTGWMVQTFQGVKLAADYDEGYFDVTVEPEIFLLGPAFPAFDSNWTVKVNVTIKIKDAPEGNYFIGIDPAPAPQEYAEKWRDAHKRRYISSGFSTLDRPYSRVELKVS